MANGFEGNEGKYRNMRLAMRGFATDLGTGTESSNAVTINDLCGLITTSGLTTSAGNSFTVTLTNSAIDSASDLVFVTVGNGTNSQGTPTLTTVTTTSGQTVIVIKNTHSSQALNGTLKIGFMVVNAI